MNRLRWPAVAAAGPALGAARAIALVASPLPTQDSFWRLDSRDPARTPSPFIGNCRIGLVIPALGLGPAPSYRAGLYEEARGDVPRMVDVPAWMPLGVCRQGGCLDSTAVGAGQVQGYHQVLDRRTGTARPSTNV